MKAKVNVLAKLHPCEEFLCALSNKNINFAFKAKGSCPDCLVTTFLELPFLFPVHAQFSVRTLPKQTAFDIQAFPFPSPNVFVVQNPIQHCTYITGNNKVYNNNQRVCRFSM